MLINCVIKKGEFGHIGTLEAVAGEVATVRWGVIDGEVCRENISIGQLEVPSFESHNLHSL